MAIKLDFTDSYSERYPESYWRPSEINLSKENKRGHIVFLGFPDEARKGKRIIGHKEYAFSEDGFIKYFEAIPSSSSKVINVSLIQAYNLAKQTKDVSGRSFFETGIDI